MGQKLNTVIIMFILLVYCVSIVIAKDCPRVCSSNGDCNFTTGICTCYEGYTGDDCSIQLEVLNEGVAVSGAVDNRLWMYYETTARDGANLFTYHLNQTNNGDCDFYVKAGALPTKTSSDQKDTSVSSSFAVNIAAHPGTVYYAGVYGYRSCEYLLNLTVKYDSVCENNCSKHGTCTLSVCTCDSTHYSNDCSLEILQLSESVGSYTAQTRENDWVYFSTRPTLVTSNPVTYESFSINLYVMDNTSSPQLYLRGESLPSFFVYDYRDTVVIEQQIAIAIGRPSYDNYMIGVYAQSVFDFRITITYLELEDCDQLCSGHGECLEGFSVCFCDEEFSGDFCETLTDNMEEGRVYTGYSHNNEWNYFHFEIESQSNFFVTLSPSEDETSDIHSCELYVQSDNLPTKTQYTYRQITNTSSSVEITVVNPLGHVWNIGVLSSLTCSFQLTVSTVPQCPSNCNERGSCSELQRCECQDGWGGDACQFEISEAGNPALFSNSIGASSWLYYRYTFPRTFEVTSLTLSLKEVNSTGYIHLYVMRGSLPTLTNVLSADTNQNSNIHSVSILVSNDGGSRDYYIGVYGTSFIPIPGAYPFKLGVYSPMITFLSYDDYL